MSSSVPGSLQLVELPLHPGVSGSEPLGPRSACPSRSARPHDAKGQRPIDSNAEHPKECILAWVDAVLTSVLHVQ